MVCFPRWTVGSGLTALGARWPPEIDAFQILPGWKALDSQEGRLEAPWAAFRGVTGLNRSLRGSDACSHEGGEVAEMGPDRCTLGLPRRHGNGCPA